MEICGEEAEIWRCASCSALFCEGAMEEQKVKGREVYQTHFTTYEENDELHKRNECSRDIKQNVARGYANLVNHVTTQHKDEYIAKVRAHIGVAVAPHN